MSKHQEWKMIHLLYGYARRTNKMIVARISLSLGTNSTPELQRLSSPERCGLISISVICNGQRSAPAKMPQKPNGKLCDCDRHCQAYWAARLPSLLSSSSFLKVKSANLEPSSYR